jgi:hypothetical protein
MRAFKKEVKRGLVQTGGHHIIDDKKKIYTKNFILHHYICLSRWHAYTKYSNKLFSKIDLKKGWHNNRQNIHWKNLLFPSKKNLYYFNGNNTDLKTDNPKSKHFWQ